MNLAKGLLRIFGFISVLGGFLALVASFVVSGAAMVLLPWGVGMLLGGAPLLGFAYALELLEDIAKNTMPLQSLNEPPPRR